jgi:hypothetical protein
MALIIVIYIRRRVKEEEEEELRVLRGIGFGLLRWL